MVILKAKGKKDGKALSIVCKCQKGEKPLFLFNGKKDVRQRIMLSLELSVCHPIAGTYIPQKSEILNVYNVLKNYFFDEKVKVEVKGEMPKLPYKKDVIY